MATTTNQVAGPRGFDLLTPIAQERLQQRVAAASGDSGIVEVEVRQQLEQLEQQAAAGDAAAQSALTAERAFLHAQLTYLERLQRAARSEYREERRGLLARLSSIWQRRS